MKNKNFVNGGPHGISQEHDMIKKGRKQVINDHWVKKSSDLVFFVQFPMYLELFEKEV